MLAKMELEGVDSMDLKKDMDAIPAECRTVEEDDGAAEGAEKAAPLSVLDEWRALRAELAKARGPGVRTRKARGHAAFV